MVLLRSRLRGRAKGLCGRAKGLSYELIVKTHMVRSMYSNSDISTGVTIGGHFFHRRTQRVWGRLELPGTSAMVVYRYYVHSCEGTMVWWSPQLPIAAENATDEGGDTFALPSATHVPPPPHGSPSALGAKVSPSSSVPFSAAIWSCGDHHTIVSSQLCT